MTYADIIVDITLEKLDRTFQYEVPTGLLPRVRPGVKVRVPFGNGGRTLDGFVLSISEEPKIDPSKMKAILEVLDERNSVEDQLMTLAAWMADHFGSTMNQALKTVLPSGRRGTEKMKKNVILQVSISEGEELLQKIQQKKNHSVARVRLLEALLEQGEIPWDVITQKLNIPSSMIRDMEKKNLLRVEEVRTFRNPLESMEGKNRAKEITLNAMQQQAVDQVRREKAAGENKTYLLYGVTGSGKTEVYIELIRDCMERGQEAIVLIPEISLTYQMVMRFYHSFGDFVSIINSRMSESEKMDQIDRAKRGDCRIMIGPRSALFTPFQNLGLIIVDEEHETSYKSEKAPRYHARDVAIRRGEIAGCPVILGSATPSVESFERAKSGEYTMLSMPERVSSRPLPTCEIIDLREELMEGNRSILSRKLQELLEERLEKKEQSILFLNRRGLAGFVSCRACGKSLKCPHCDVSLSLHKDHRLHCHYCGYTEPMVKQCPHCGSPYIGGFRVGTEMVEKVVQERFPEARVLRMDADTTKGKDGHREILEKFSNEEADILIGTQMIVKGHDFPKVTLVGILAADMSLNASDYRGAERTFQLLTQAAGRAGRGELPGDVVIQTYQPEHYSIVAAAQQSYLDFFEEEIEYRNMMAYPPAGHLLMILFTSVNYRSATEQAEEVAAFIKDADPGLRILGPDDAPIAKIQDVYRKILYLKDESYDRLIDAKNQIGDFIRAENRHHDTYIWFDFDPQ